MRRSFDAKPTSAAMRIAAGYLFLATIATALALALRDGMPWDYPKPWVPLAPMKSVLMSAALGIGTALMLISATRLTVERFAWARRLHLELRPVARDLSASQVLVVAGLSSIGEELLFRGLLTPLLGIVLSSIAFGLVHQIRGPSRWVWTAWASLVGLALAAIFVATGSLVGPIIAHALVNAVNLAFLRDHDPAAQPV